MHIPVFPVHTALKITSPNGKSYSDRLDTVKTEKQLSAIFDDFINMVPMGQKLFGSLNPVHTGGPMGQHCVCRAAYGRLSVENRRTVRQKSLRGGLWFGTYHLLNYPASYSEPLYRFADFNAGWYASRNAAFQSAVSRASGVKLALDGDLIAYGSSKAGTTELAVRKLSATLGMSDSDIRRQLEKGIARRSRRRISTKRFSRWPRRRVEKRYRGQSCRVFNWKARKSRVTRQRHGSPNASTIVGLVAWDVNGDDAGVRLTRQHRESDNPRGRDKAKQGAHTQTNLNPRASVILHLHQMFIDAGA